MAHRAKHAAIGIYGKISGDEEAGPRHGQQNEYGSSKNFHGHKGGNNKQGGNHTHRLPSWKRPHSRPLPICRYPPPPQNGHHRPLPPPQHAPNLPLPEFAGSPDHHMSSGFAERPHNGAHNGPEIDEPSHHGHHEEARPPYDPHFDGHVPHNHRPGFDQLPPPPSSEFDELPQPHYGSPPGQDHSHEGPPPPSALHEHGFPPPSPPPHNRRPNHNVGHTLHIVKFTSIGFLCAFLLAALHRRVCASSRRADRHERRRRRRALRREAHKHIITRLLARMAGNESGDEDDDEKKTGLLEDAEDGVSTTMSEDIAQLRNAAEVVGDMIEHVAVGSKGQTHAQAPPSQAPAPAPPISESILIPVTNAIPLMHAFEEELPAYEDNDGVEMDSAITDGYRPGMLYAPSQSSDGGLSDILGPDAKS